MRVRRWLLATAATVLVTTATGCSSATTVYLAPDPGPQPYPSACLTNADTPFTLLPAQNKLAPLCGHNIGLRVPAGWKLTPEGPSHTGPSLASAVIAPAASATAVGPRISFDVPNATQVTNTATQAHAFGQLLASTPATTVTGHGTLPGANPDVLGASPYVRYRQDVRVGDSVVTVEHMRVFINLPKARTLSMDFAAPTSEWKSSFTSVLASFGVITKG